MAYSRIFENPWYVQRSIENNPLHPLNRSNLNGNLESIIKAVPIDNNYPENNSTSSDIGRVANRVLSYIPVPVKKVAMVSGLAGLLYLLTACGSGATPTARPTPTPPRVLTSSVDLSSTKIAFVVHNAERQNSDIYVINGDGSNEKRLTSATCADIDPVWSPDGKRIAFVSYRDFYPDNPHYERIGYPPQQMLAGFVNNSNIYVMNADGSRQIRLTSSNEDDLSPSWSPDGNKIAYENSNDIFIMNSNGYNKTFLTSGQSPAWSPAEDKIAFIDNDKLYTINADGSNKTMLASFGVTNFKWSPDGKRIAFTQKVKLKDDPNRITYNLDVINNDGSGHVTLFGGDVVIIEPPSGRTFDVFPLSSVLDKQITTKGGHLVMFVDDPFISSGNQEKLLANNPNWYKHYSNVPQLQLMEEYHYTKEPIYMWLPHTNLVAVGGYYPKGIYTTNSLSIVDIWGNRIDSRNWKRISDKNARHISWSPILYPHTTQGIEAIVEKEELPEYLSNNPQAKAVYNQASTILQDPQLTLQDKQKKIKVLQNTLGEEVVTEVIRHIPVYDEFSGGLVPFDAYLRSLAERFGEGYSQISKAPIDVDPVGAGMRMFFDTTPETILAMTGLYNEQKGNNQSPKSLGWWFKINNCKEH